MCRRPHKSLDKSTSMFSVIRPSSGVYGFPDRRRAFVLWECSNGIGDEQRPSISDDRSVGVIYANKGSLRLLSERSPRSPGEIPPVSTPASSLKALRQFA